MAKFKKKFFFYILLLIFLTGFFYLLFNDRGLIKYLKLKSEVDSLQIQISKLEDQNENLKNEIDSLKNKIPEKIEQTAREKYDMLHKGEIKIEVKEKNNEK